jgi:hypothetical protein
VSVKLEYTGHPVKPINTNHCIEPVGPAFIVIDPAGEQVGTYPTKEAAQQEIERCKREEKTSAMYAV